MQKEGNTYSTSARFQIPIGIQVAYLDFSLRVDFIGLEQCPNVSEFQQVWEEGISLPLRLTAGTEWAVCVLCVCTCMCACVLCVCACVRVCARMCSVCVCMRRSTQLGTSPLHEIPLTNPVPPSFFLSVLCPGRVENSSRTGSLYPWILAVPLCSQQGPHTWGVTDPAVSVTKAGLTRAGMPFKVFLT